MSPVGVKGMLAAVMVGGVENPSRTVPSPLIKDLTGRPDYLEIIGHQSAPEELAG